MYPQSYPGVTSRQNPIVLNTDPSPGNSCRPEALPTDSHPASSPSHQNEVPEPLPLPVLSRNPEQLATLASHRFLDDWSGREEQQQREAVPRQLGMLAARLMGPSWSLDAKGQGPRAPCGAEFHFEKSSTCWSVLKMVRSQGDIVCSL